MADTAAANTANTANTTTGTTANTNTATNTAADPVFTREQLAASKKYRNQSDIIYAVLDKDKSYTLAEVDAAIKTFMGKEVK